MLFAVFRTYPNCPLRNYPVKYAEFSGIGQKELILIMVSSFTSAPPAVFTILRKAGSSSRNLGFGFRYFTAAGQYFVDGGRILVAFTQLDVWIPTLMSYVPDWLHG